MAFFYVSQEGMMIKFRSAAFIVFMFKSQRRKELRKKKENEKKKDSASAQALNCAFQMFPIIIFCLRRENFQSLSHLHCNPRAYFFNIPRNFIF